MQQTIIRNIFLFSAALFAAIVTSCATPADISAKTVTDTSVSVSGLKILESGTLAYVNKKDFRNDQKRPPPTQKENALIICEGSIFAESGLTSLSLFDTYYVAYAWQGTITAQKTHNIYLTTKQTGSRQALFNHWKYSRKIETYALRFTLEKPIYDYDLKSKGYRFPVAVAQFGKENEKDDVYRIMAVLKRHEKTTRPAELLSFEQKFQVIGQKGTVLAELFKHEFRIYDSAAKDAETIKLALGIWYTLLNFHAEFERVKGWNWPLL